MEMSSCRNGLDGISFFAGTDGGGTETGWGQEVGGSGWGWM